MKRTFAPWAFLARVFLPRTLRGIVFAGRVGALSSAASQASDITQVFDTITSGDALVASTFSATGTSEAFGASPATGVSI